MPEVTDAAIPLIPMRPDRIVLETTVGKVVVSIKIENLQDAWLIEQGQLSPEEARVIEITDALVDTGCSILGLPSKYIRKLGLIAMYRRPIRTASGLTETTVYGAVRLTVQDRYCSMDVLEVPDSISVLIGQIPLEQLDFMIDMKNQKLIGNPQHGGEHVLEAY